MDSPFISLSLFAPLTFLWKETLDFGGILLMASLWFFSYFYPQDFLKLAVDFQITFSLGVTTGGALSLKKFPGKSQ